MAEVKAARQGDIPLLSTGDVVILLTHHLPRRDLDGEELFRHMERRHKQRQRSIDAAYPGLEGSGIL